MRDYLYDWAINATTDNEIKRAQDLSLDVIAHVKTEMDNDKENDSSLLLNMYLSANTKERAIMDAMLVSLCGMYMGNIIENACFLKPKSDVDQAKNTYTNECDSCSHNDCCKSPETEEGKCSVQ